MLAALAGAQSVHLWYRPSTVIPRLEPDFIGLDKEREEDEQARKIVRGEAL